jgi:hypothetical protein
MIVHALLVPAIAGRGGRLPCVLHDFEVEQAPDWIPLNFKDAEVEPASR